MRGGLAGGDQQVISALAIIAQVGKLRHGCTLPPMVTVLGSPQTWELLGCGSVSEAAVWSRVEPCQAAVSEAAV